METQVLGFLLQKPNKFFPLNASSDLPSVVKSKVSYLNMANWLLLWELTLEWSNDCCLYLSSCGHKGSEDLLGLSGSTFSNLVLSSPLGLVSCSCLFVFFWLMPARFGFYCLLLKNPKQYVSHAKIFPNFPFPQINPWDKSY